jgi:hypothetical protein
MSCQTDQRDHDQEIEHVQKIASESQKKGRRREGVMQRDLFSPRPV